MWVRLVCLGPQATWTGETTRILLERVWGVGEVADHHLEQVEEGEVEADVVAVEPALRWRC